ncbi:hypothetical protein BS47DRAFT_1338925 [Hydnum rufescens UP504]|uniref:Uncharacterized protein n=1 Tax=Hydnum rufescens UP504 TaxID=1448309 RepID=A0A9P6B5S3_9AGAM|nr:hypothetical protein BS47DRAFT_1338925 [Hydnum rufescens UP504]
MPTRPNISCPIPDFLHRNVLNHPTQHETTYCMRNKIHREMEAAEQLTSRYQSPPYIPPLNAIIHSSSPQPRN